MAFAELMRIGQRARKLKWSEIQPGQLELRRLFLVLLALASACSMNRPAVLPSDFSLVMDVRTSEGGRSSNIHVTIDSKGRGRFEVYDSEGVHRYDQNGILTYDEDRVSSQGEFDLSSDDQQTLWTAIQGNRFFDLTDDYRMAIGHSFAFIMIEAEGKTHIVDNIGMEVPQVRALVAATDAVVPDELTLEYGDGYIRR